MSLKAKQQELQDNLVESIRLANELYKETQDGKYRDIKRGLIKNVLPRVNSKFSTAIRGLIRGTDIRLLDEMYERFKEGFLSNVDAPISEDKKTVTSDTNSGFGTVPPKMRFVKPIEKKNVGLADNFIEDLEKRRVALFDDIGTDNTTAKKERPKQPVKPVSKELAEQGDWSNVDVDENGVEIPFNDKVVNSELSKEVIDTIDAGVKNGLVEEVNAVGLVREIALMTVTDFHTQYGAINKQIAEQLGIKEPKKHYKQLAAQIIHKAKELVDSK